MHVFFILLLRIFHHRHEEWFLQVGREMTGSRLLPRPYLPRSLYLCIFLYILFLLQCVLFFPILFVFCNLHVSASSFPPLLSCSRVLHQRIWRSLSPEHWQSSSLLFDMDIVPKTDRKTQTRNSNKVKRSLLKIWSWLPRMRILNWNV